MCLICEGWTYDEVLTMIDERIVCDGFAVVGADGPQGSVWAYTIGLAELDHPDLLVANVEPATAEAVLTHLAARVVDGDRFTTVDRVDHRDGDVEGETLRDVHPVHVERGLVATAEAYAEWSGDPEPLLRYRQVVLPASMFCPCHAGTQPPLHLGHVLFGTSGPTRPERRRSARRSRRGRR